MDLIADPTAHLSSDPRDVYNNILLFVVKEDRRAANKAATPTEMHIFQCNRVSVSDLLILLAKYEKNIFHIPFTFMICWLSSTYGSIVQIDG